MLCIPWVLKAVVFSKSGTLILRTPGRSECLKVDCEVSVTKPRLERAIYVCCDIPGDKNIVLAKNGPSEIQKALEFIYKLIKLSET